MHCSGVAKGITFLFIIAAGPATGQSASTQVYKSTGDGGENLYSDRPPPTGQAERVEITPSPSKTDGEKSKAEVEEVNRALDEIAAQRRQDEADRLAEKQARERRETKCEESRSWLNQLELYPPNRRLVVYPDGTSKRVSWEEMQGLLDSARLEVSRNCGEE